MTRFTITALITLCAAATAVAQPVNGFVDTFSGTDLNEWGSNFNPVANPGVDGADGPNDGFMEISQPNLGRLFARQVVGNDYIGDYLGAGITAISFELKALDNADNLNIRFGIGQRFTGFWSFTQEFAITNEWQTFTVDLTDESLWTRIIDDGQGLTFNQALSDVNALRIAHEEVIPAQLPADINGGRFGVDNIRFVPEPTSLLLLATGVLILRRR